MIQNDKNEINYDQTENSIILKNIKKIVNPNKKLNIKSNILKHSDGSIMYCIKLKWGANHDADKFSNSGENIHTQKKL